jgi:hypothetical protein
VRENKVDIMLRILAIMTAGSLIAIPGFVQGIWSGRWNRSQELETAVASLERVPLHIGEWKGHSVQLDRDQIEGADLAGYLCVRYENQRDGRIVTVILMCGRSGPVSVHTPDICWPGAGYDLVARPSRWNPGIDYAAQPAEFWTARFQKNEAAAPFFRRVYWAWSAGGAWQAPDKPRLAYARHSALYKLYLIQEVSGTDEQVPDEECDDFIQLLLPELEQALFATS